MFKLLLSLIIGLIPLQILKQFLYTMIFDYKFGKKVYIGFSLIVCKKAFFGDGCKIGHFNLIIGVNNFVANNGVTIRRFNWIRDVNEFILDYCSIISKKNRFTRSAHLTQYGDFYLGPYANITVGHLFDLIDNIKIGAKTTIAGMGTQFWTHGFDNYNNRIQGPIVIGESCYIGSRCLINLGIQVADYTQIGMGSIVAKSICEPYFFWAGSPAIKRKPIEPITETKDVELSMKYQGYHLFFRKINC